MSVCVGDRKREREERESVCERERERESGVLQFDNFKENLLKLETSLEDQLKAEKRTAKS